MNGVEGEGGSDEGIAIGLMLAANDVIRCQCYCDEAQAAPCVAYAKE